MKLKISSILVLFLLMVVICVGCKKTAHNLILKKIDPSSTKAGVLFNMQPGGVSAIGAITENATENTVIMWGEKKIKTDFNNPQLLTAIVPRALYLKPGLYQIYLLDTKTGAQSNSLTFIVE